MAEDARDHPKNTEKEVEARKAEKERAKDIRTAELRTMNIWWQYVIGSIVVIGGFICGTCIGWSSPASVILQGTYLTTHEFAWVSSIFALGASISQFLVWTSIYHIGLKYTIVLFEVLTGIAWLPIMFSHHNFYALLFGRLFLGLSGGFCSACPMYCAEMAHRYLRGTIGVLFQLYITVGILYTYILGVPGNFAWINWGCAIWCIIGAVLTLLFVPHSPYMLLENENTDEAIAVMRQLRGRNYNYIRELAEIQVSLRRAGNAADEIRQKANIRATLVLLAIHAFQQLTGINALLYHAHSIFTATKTHISINLSSIIIAVMQVVMAIVATFCIDRAGRICLFVISLIIMGISLSVVGLYFSIAQSGGASPIGILPTIALLLYISGFSLGTGPIPWLLIGEYLPKSIRTSMGAIISSFNWLLAFAITWAMPVLMEKSNPAFIFYTFAVICVIGILFALMFVVETNQKSFEQIQMELMTHKYKCRAPKIGGVK